MSMRIPISRPYFGDEERAAIVEPLETGWVVQGPKVAEFERLFGAYAGAANAVATSSCTTALHLSLVGLGVGPGDEVILPSFTWVATANAVEMVGARPVFVDIELDTFNVDPARVDAAVTSRTRAIIPVSLFGVSAQIDPIMQIAARHDLKVVEDAACAVGSWYGGRHAGTIAHAGCFSFHPRKAITTGEGGMVITSDDELAQSIRSLRDHGASRSDLSRHLGKRSYVLPDFDRVGYNYRMTDIQGALGVVQMGRLEAILELRTERARVYDRRLKDVGWLRPQALPDDCTHGYQSYVCLYEPEAPTLANLEGLHQGRNKLMDSLEAAGIATRPGTHAVHALGFYRRKYDIHPEDLPNSLIADRLTIALPLYAQMTPQEQDYVLEHLTASPVEAR
jgi:dTDP-4-amino-4,6-dideoxygalactose transaminase